ncbi:MAG: glycerophosphodiester phosphodiesterase family protein [Chryseolinea sp.]
MKNITILSLMQVFLIMSSTNSFSGNAISPIYLTSYIISNSTEYVGEVKSRTGKLISAEISGESSSEFVIDKANKITVRKGKLKSNVSVFDIIITAKTSDGMVSETFQIVKDDFIQNKVIAHRGAWKNTGATENSIASLRHAIDLGCQGSEFDVHMSADSLLLINHDAAITGKSIAKSQSLELLSIKLSNGETMPTLENYLGAGMAQTKTKLILEIKESELGKESSIALTRKIIALVEGLHAQAWIDYISFDYDVCKEVMRLCPYAKVAYLKGDKAPDDLSADHFYGLDYHFTVIQKHPDWVKDAHDRNLTVNVWTVNDKSVLEDMLKQQVDFITTNEPEMLLDLVKK